MHVKVILTKDNGEAVEFSRSLSGLDSTNILASLEQEVCAVQQAAGSFLSTAVLEDHQAGFAGEKNTEEKWND